ncbi:transmembrane protein, putative (macronuclear) [Tetrahymena thermophila SB210]|uniref:Transmembrane protein, putative n=1 Tax=Tetrahymena thermophila (strain SB210) TaxID=312017 RepID=I7MAR2_TETTS|nr:transmembrane protein, putative [Tetrahymena thermophila SB210]EAS05141.1 transmembrane protein, putative [Tetrahymena thermophila SB210]|eukprot:XP_001025386.1 transmembrane protein, putative [Tetrahymena thermophila SB210]
MDGETFPFSLKILFNCVLRVSNTQRFVKYFALLNIFSLHLGIFFTSIDQRSKQIRIRTKFVLTSQFSIQDSVDTPLSAQQHNFQYLIEILQESIFSALEIGSIPSNCESLLIYLFLIWKLLQKY